MDFSKPPADLAQIWYLGRLNNDGNHGFLHFIEWLLPGVLPRICDIQFNLLLPMVADELTHPAALDLLAVATDPQRLRGFGQPWVQPASDVEELFNIAAEQAVSPKALAWCKAKVYATLSDYPDALLYLADVYTNDITGIDTEQVMITSLRAQFNHTLDPAPLTASDAHSLYNAYEQLTLQHLVQAVNERHNPAA